MTQDWIDLDNERLIEVSKPLFYGFVILAAFTIISAPAYAGALLGVAVMAAITFVSAGLTDLLEEDYLKLAEIISVTTLLAATLGAAYIAFSLSTAL